MRENRLSVEFHLFQPYNLTHADNTDGPMPAVDIETV